MAHVPTQLDYLPAPLAYLPAPLAYLPALVAYVRPRSTCLYYRFSCQKIGQLTGYLGGRFPDDSTTFILYHIPVAANR